MTTTAAKTKDVLENAAEIWLPTDFLGDDTATGAKRVAGGVWGGGMWRADSEVKLDLPKTEALTDLWLKFDVSSPTDSSAAESEEEEFFTELTQRLSMYQIPEAAKVSGGSPQSILGGIGSWSGRSSNGSNHSPLQGPSPPATPYEARDDTVDLIYAAAGQVARLKMNDMNNEGRLKPSVNATHYTSAPPDMSFSTPHIQKPSLYSNQNMKQNYINQANNAAFLCEHHLQNLTRAATLQELTQSARPSLQRPQVRVPARANFQGVQPVRKESAGTGVFLPRRYDSNTSPATAPRKRPANTTAVLPAKVVHASNMSFEEMVARSQPHYSAYSASMSHQSYEALMSRRNALLAQQQQRRILSRSEDVSLSNIEVCLPQEWSY